MTPVEKSLMQKLLWICHVENVRKQQAHYPECFLQQPNRFLWKDCYSKKNRKAKGQNNKDDWYEKLLILQSCFETENWTRSSCWIWSLQVIKIMTWFKTQAQEHNYNHSRQYCSTKKMFHLIKSTDKTYLFYLYEDKKCKTKLEHVNNRTDTVTDAETTTLNFTSYNTKTIKSVLCLSVLKIT